jgi:hypothetical protein
MHRGERWMTPDGTQVVMVREIPERRGQMMYNRQK